MAIRLTRRGFIAGTTAAATLHPFSVRAQAGQAHLRLMETTDIHVHVMPYDYYADTPVDTVGLARTADLINQVRGESTNSLLFDNGDFLQGNPMGDYMAYEKGMDDQTVHPVIKAFNALGYDAGTIGNHEFNYGLDFLMKSVDDAEFPIVLANVATELGATAPEDTTLVPPYTMIDREITDGAGETFPIRIGVIGFVPPQIMTWDSRHLEGKVQVRDIVRTAEAYIPVMREEGAELIVALAHSGIGSAGWTEMMENAAIPLAALDGIDVVMTGHSHLVFPSPDYADWEGVDVEAGTISGKPGVMAGFWGSHMGLVDLMLERDGNSWKVAGHVCEARPISRREEDRSITPLAESDPAVLASVEEEHEATLAYVRQAVGKTDAPLHSYFALVADDPSVQIVSAAQLWYLEQQLAGGDYADLPLLSAAAPFKAGGRGGPEYYTDVPAGDVAIKNVADLYLYPNTVRAVKVTGQQVKDWLERSAGMFNQITPGEADQVLLNPDFPSYNFDVIDGVEYQIDLSQPSRFDREGAVINEGAERIVNLTYQGEPIAMDQEFIIATNNYRAGGGGSFPGADGSTIVFEGPDTNRDVIVRFLAEQDMVSPSADGNWSFAPMEGTSVLFDTGPGGAQYMESVPNVRISPAGDTPEGFARFRIDL